MAYTTNLLRGKTFHIAKALNAQTDKERKKFATLAATYVLSENEKKLVDMLQEDDFSFTRIYKEMGKDWAVIAMDWANKLVRLDYEKGMREYFKKR